MATFEQRCQQLEKEGYRAASFIKTSGKKRLRIPNLFVREATTETPKTFGIRWLLDLKDEFDQPISTYDAVAFFDGQELPRKRITVRWLNDAIYNHKTNTPNGTNDVNIAFGAYLQHTGKTLRIKKVVDNTGRAADIGAEDADTVFIGPQDAEPIELRYARAIAEQEAEMFKWNRQQALSGMKEGLYCPACFRKRAATGEAITSLDDFRTLRLVSTKSIPHKDGTNGNSFITEFLDFSCPLGHGMSIDSGPRVVPLAVAPFAGAATAAAGQARTPLAVAPAAQAAE